jgi:hypothetical protein
MKLEGKALGVLTALVFAVLYLLFSWIYRLVFMMVGLHILFNNLDARYECNPYIWYCMLVTSVILPVNIVLAHGNKTVPLILGSYLSGFISLLVLYNYYYIEDSCKSTFENNYSNLWNLLKVDVCATYIAIIALPIIKILEYLFYRPSKGKTLCIGIGGIYLEDNKPAEPVTTTNPATDNVDTVSGVAETNLSESATDKLHAN